MPRWLAVLVVLLLSLVQSQMAWFKVLHSRCSHHRLRKLKFTVPLLPIAITYVAGKVSTTPLHRFTIQTFSLCRPNNGEEVLAVGRPREEVDIYEIEYLRTIGFHWSEVALLLGSSRSTLYRRLSELGIDPHLHYSSITDSQLDREIRAIKLQHPNDGEVLVAANLRSRGIHVQRSRLRASIHRIDPDGVETRRRIAVHRRVYCVPHPNYIWHIDGTHKMIPIRWRLVIHGGIDGFSRTVVYLKCSSDNCAATVMGSFHQAVQTYGIPLRIRSDHGGENIRVWDFMLQHHSDTSCVLTGSSTHNERVERLWRDVNRCVTTPFRNTFQELEARGLLDPLNEVDIFCLHYIFLPRINLCLLQFQESWNHHAISTENNLTPMQLFVGGFTLLTQQNPDGAACSPGASTGSSGVSNLATPAISSTPIVTVAVPHMLFLPCAGLQQSLQQINPLAHSDNFGLDLYQQAITIIARHLAPGCSMCA